MRVNSKTSGVPQREERILGRPCPALGGSPITGGNGMESQAATRSRRTLVFLIGVIRQSREESTRCDE
jgi:hypothetical protein